MSVLRRVPPGRAGRLWLSHRLEVAERGANLLDQKLRILHTERQRLALREQRTRDTWEDAGREAQTWLLRAGLLDGQRAIRLGQEAGTAQVEVAWTQSMGVRYPAEASCSLPPPDPAAPTVGGSALAAARDAYRQALQAAVQHAVAQAATAVVLREERSTRRRLRAIENRWVPRLEEAAAQVEFLLEERERAEAVRLRWATGRRPQPSKGTGEEARPWRRQ